jgi:phosphoserine aminotransferase
MLPEAVLKKAAGEMLDYHGSGMSVKELSHRSKEFLEILAQAEAGLRGLMVIPDEYAVLFLQGGASTQFAMVPLNLMGEPGRADYVVTGNWAKKAAEEARLFGEVRVAASSEDKRFSYIPKRTRFSPDADYVHITSNNTVEGTRYAAFPDTGKVPLVNDMSSEILSRVVDVTRFGLVYAGAQKNIGPSGVTLVIVRRDLVHEPARTVPTMMRYDIHHEAGSLHNTPPCYAIYMAGLVFEWVAEQGGVRAMQERNEAKAKLLYDYLDQSNFFTNQVAREDRSIMNVPFSAPSDELDAKFVAEAKAAGLTTLKGHRSVGGMRASIYNAMPLAGVRALVEFMDKFEQANREG